MTDLERLLKPWVLFAGFVLTIAVLYWAQAVLVPLAVALLLTFVLAPPVTWMERWANRGVAVGARAAYHEGARVCGSAARARTRAARPPPPRSSA